MERETLPLQGGGVGVWRSLSSGRFSMQSNIYKRDVESASDFNERLGLPFNNLSHLVRALTHRSYVNEHPEAVEDNERLEFLGDAILAFMVAEWVFHRFPEMPEGNLTKIRSAFVMNERLAVFARKLDVGRALRLGRGEASSGGHEKLNTLGSAFEALIGAIYLEAGLAAVKKFLIPLLEEARDTVLMETHDYKSELQVFAQSRRMVPIVYRVVNSSGPEHAMIFEVEVVVAGQVLGRGTGPNKAAAERMAACEALQVLMDNE